MPDEVSQERDVRGTLAEAAIVAGLTVGLPLALTLGRWRGAMNEFGDRRLLTTLAAELILAVCIVPVLVRFRGWRPNEIAGSPGPIDILRGASLWLSAFVAYYASALAWLVFVPAMSQGKNAFVPTGHAATWVIILTSIVSPMFEEFLFLGYGVARFPERLRKRASMASVALRTALHLYQGSMAVIGILPLGIVFTLYYYRTRRLWPVVVAHIAFDAIGLAAILR